jgi:hypothetical protein
VDKLFEALLGYLVMSIAVELFDAKTVNRLKKSPNGHEILKFLGSGFDL